MSTIRLLIGTKKAAFIYSSDEGRKTWELSEPMMAGWSVSHVTADFRGETPRFYAATNHPVWGPSIAKSADEGATWEQRSEGLGFPKDSGLTIASIWNVIPGHASEPGVVYAGTAPGGLFKSEDWGATWQGIDAFNGHENRALWQGIPGGQSPVHSIIIDPADPKHIYLSSSGGGSYVTLDGGERWVMFSHHAKAQTEEARVFISQTAAAVPPGWDPASITDFHHMEMDPKDPNRLWAQAHWGVFRSDDGGRSWEDVTHMKEPQGLPSFHGFPITVTKREPDAAFVVPLEMGTDNLRTVLGQFTVYRTRDAGATWEPLTNGLPGPDDFQSCYRESMDTDGLESEGVYVGTSNGHVYASIDGGDRWERLPGTLPPILSLTCAVN
ncbi:MAG: exo-alpha-sialidase [Chloroflexi bacterium]|nr:exo-alpha-sialidase [Chloroflexota bacterium]